MRARGLPRVLLAIVLVGSSCGTREAPTDVSSLEKRYEGSFTVLESPDHGPELCALVATSLPPQCSGLPVGGWDWENVEGEESRNGTTWGRWHVVGSFDGRVFALVAPPAPPRPARSPNLDFSPACDEPEVQEAEHGMAERDSMSQDFGGFEIPGEVAVWVSNAGPDDSAPFVANVIVQPGNAAEARRRIRANYSGRLCLVERDAPSTKDLEGVQNQVADDEARTTMRTVGASIGPRGGVVVADVWIASDGVKAYAHKRWGDLVELRSVLSEVK